MRGSERWHLYVLLDMHLLVSLSNYHVPHLAFTLTYSLSKYSWLLLLNSSSGLRLANSHEDLL
jgi:hypothetical protein